MRDSAALFDPIVEVRDVVESYLVDNVVIANWQTMLSTAAGQFASLATRSADVEITQLADEIEELIRVGLPKGERLARIVAQRVGQLLDEMSPGGRTFERGGIQPF